MARKCVSCHCCTRGVQQLKELMLENMRSRFDIFSVVPTRKELIISVLQGAPVRIRPKSSPTRHFDGFPTAVMPRATASHMHVRSGNHA